MNTRYKKMASTGIKHNVTGEQMLTYTVHKANIWSDHLPVYKHMYGLKQFRFIQTLNCDGKWFHGTREPTDSLQE